MDPAAGPRRPLLHLRGAFEAAAAAAASPQRANRTAGEEAAAPAPRNVRCGNCDRKGHTRDGCPNPKSSRRRAIERRALARELLAADDEEADLQQALHQDAAEQQRQDEAAGGAPLEERAAAAALQGEDDQDELAQDLQSALLADAAEQQRLDEAAGGAPSGEPAAAALPPLINALSAERASQIRRSTMGRGLLYRDLWEAGLLRREEVYLAWAPGRR